jgi:hypothetical protein
MTRDPETDPRTRDLGTWLDTVEKVVFSRTLQEANWENSRIARDIETEVKALKNTPGRDILVLNSASIIQALLRHDLIDDLRMAVVPATLGGGLRPPPRGHPARQMGTGRSDVPRTRRRRPALSPLLTGTGLIEVRHSHAHPHLRIAPGELPGRVRT